ncbi:D-alanyl-D-alanine carboxypeptidase [Arcticibacter svalbardensis MN12-7]|uniref:D-alanyl-D-alanine carboxypeptidase n=1 Tax=Arcticibacter svalbardensis MN12-7 TaxID=1150600 RepID=R9GNG1_9SPHI|nr:D-alanyl-D-alanine carboxypeptidase/D-alanyl-D-alanine-endopeptidase [Arcticibacter svalbardensis]EOR93226.1 D-alanyl-D-alanine carboxypeptidase [Arcticibacter svalbardensis MN12-7]
MKIACTIVLLAISKMLSAQSLPDKIAKAFAQFERDGQLQYGLTSLTVLNSASGEVVFSKNGNTGLAPASTLKTITSITGYNILKPDYKWETTLAYTGSIKAGVLYGDLIVKGTGDPTLGSDRYTNTKSGTLLNRWLEATKKAGIAKIEGRVIADDLLFGTQTIPDGWIWGDIGNYYGAGATSLNWRENEIELTIIPGSKTGMPVQIKNRDPEVEGLRLINELKTGISGSGDQVYGFSAPFTDLTYLRGTYAIDLKKRIVISMADPAYLLASQLQAHLSKAGITINGKTSTTRRLSMENNYRPLASITIDRYLSPGFSQIVYWLNQKSLNLYAENILKSMALKSDKPATFQNGVSTLTSYWNKRLGIDSNAISILDGSGLAPENRITTAVMAKILNSAKTEDWFPDFYASLPVYNNMKMKSGSIRNVLAYAGYEMSVSGTPLVFSFITNNYSGSTSSIKQKMFRVLDTLK